jgi:hypothetical protein
MSRSMPQPWWLLVFVCAVAVGGLPHDGMAAATPSTGAKVRVMFLIKGSGQDGGQVVETTLTQAFQTAGFTVVDAAAVAQTLRRDADLLKLYEIEAAKRLGSRLGADIVVSGEVKSRTSEKAYTLLEGKKVAVSQAHISVKAVLVSSGKVLAAENAHARKPFDTTGEIALQTAAQGLAGTLVQGVERFLQRDTVDYRLVVLNLNHAQALEFQAALQGREGVRRVSEQGFVDGMLQLEVSVDKAQDAPFKHTLFAGLPGLGLGRFEVVAREGEAVYLRKTGGTAPPRPRPGPSRPQQSSAPGPAPPDLPQTAPQQTRTDSPTQDSPAAPSSSLSARYKTGYRKSWAVVIGINDYQHWPKLEYAVNDARSVERLLKKLGFDEVITLLDGEATRQRILYALGDEVKAKAGDEDRVLIFYAGHGQTEDLRDRSKLGWIIPVDGDLKNLASTAISMRELQDHADRIRAKHILYAMDACFSGLLLRLRGVDPADRTVMELTTAPARQVLTAGAEGEQVVEFGGHGLFTKSLLVGLEGGADLNDDGYITARELYEFVSRRVQEDSRNMQNPQFGPLGFGRGEFVFALRQ